MNRKRNNGTVNILGRFRVSKAFLAIGTVVVLIVAYVVLISLVSNKGVTVSQLETQKSNLEGQNERLSVEAARLQSLEVIDQNASGEVEIGQDISGADSQESGSDSSGSQEVTLQQDSSPNFVPVSEADYLPTDGFVASR